LAPTLAPASREIACSSFWVTAASGKIASTPSSRIWLTSLSTSRADAWACVDSDGITAPITLTP
jgi:hypothetical protein